MGVVCFKVELFYCGNHWTALQPTDPPFHSLADFHKKKGKTALRIVGTKSSYRNFELYEQDGFFQIPLIIPISLRGKSIGFSKHRTSCSQQFLFFSPNQNKLYTKNSKLKLVIHPMKMKM